MGLKNTGGYIFYDGNNSQGLDPAKPAAREYLCGLAKEAAELKGMSLTTYVKVCLIERLSEGSKE